MRCWTRPPARRGFELCSDGAEQLLELARLEHLDEDVAAADELPVDVDLRDGGPAREILDSLAKRRVGQDVDVFELGAAPPEDFHGAGREAALREVLGALHEKDDLVALEGV